MQSSSRGERERISQVAPSIAMVKVIWLGTILFVIGFWLGMIWLVSTAA